MNTKQHSMAWINKPKKKPVYHKAGLNSDIAKIYNSKEWKALRNGYLLQHPLCEMCLEEGKVTATQEIHHIRPISTGKDELEMKELAYNPDNLMALCTDCHHKIHQLLKKEL